jgi:hypothetical protein
LDVEHAPFFFQQALVGCGDLGDLALQVAHAGLARVVAHDVEQRLVGDLQLGLLQPVGLDLLRHQVAARDVSLNLRIAGRRIFHAIEQRRGMFMLLVQMNITSESRNRLPGNGH